MARVIITQALRNEIERTLKADSKHVFAAMKTLEEQPKKGKILATTSGITIKELKFKSFRFYCITDGHTLKFGSQDQLAVLLIKFVKMSKKDNQQQIINQIKDTLRTLGFDSF